MWPSLFTLTLASGATAATLSPTIRHRRAVLPWWLRVIDHHDCYHPRGDPLPQHNVGVAAEQAKIVDAAIDSPDANTKKVEVMPQGAGVSLCCMGFSFTVATNC